MTLAVYLHDVHAGSLERNNLLFSYDDDYLQGKGPPLSISLPVTRIRHRGRAFFRGLLPDETIKLQLARNIGISPTNDYLLLKAVGRECAGAVSLYSQEQKPLAPKTHNERLDSIKLATVLENLATRPLLAGRNNLRLSLAGAQHKIAVLINDDGIFLTTEATTHIIKPAMADFPDSVVNELFCMSLAKRIGITVPDCSMHMLAGKNYFCVQRYDRLITNKKIIRVHQEDFCQALGILPENKYEREGGPSIGKCLELLTNYSATPARDIQEFIRRIIFNFLIGNSDAHSKNFSLLYQQTTRPQLAPAYDLLSTAIYPQLSTKMAMKIGGKYRPDDVRFRHWQLLVPKSKSAHSNLRQTMINIAKSTISHAKNLQQQFIDQQETVDKICHVISNRARFLDR